jgi:hypothetical protein
MRTSSSRAQILNLLGINSPVPNNHSNADNPTRRKLQGRLHNYRYNVERLPYAKNIQGPNGTAYEVSAQYLEALNQIMFLLQNEFNMTPGGKCITPTNPIYTELKCYLNGMPGAESKSQIVIGGCDNTTTLPDEAIKALTDLCAAPPGNDSDIYIIGGITGGLAVLLCLFLSCIMYHSRKHWREEWRDRITDERRRLGLPPNRNNRDNVSEEEMKEADDYADHEHYDERKETYDERKDGHPYVLVPTSDQPLALAPAASTAIGIRRPSQ